MRAPLSCSEIGSIGLKGRLRICSESPRDHRCQRLEGVLEQRRECAGEVGDNRHERGANLGGQVHQRGLGRVEDDPELTHQLIQLALSSVLAISRKAVSGASTVAHTEPARPVSAVSGGSPARA